MIQRLKAKALAFWASLPHWAQAGVVLFVSTAGTTITHAIADGMIPHSWADVKHLAGTAAIAGFVAVRAFYMLPNGKAQLVAAGKAALDQRAAQVPPQP